MTDMTDTVVVGNYTFSFVSAWRNKVYVKNCGEDVFADKDKDGKELSYITLSDISSCSEVINIEEIKLPKTNFDFQKCFGSLLWAIIQRGDKKSVVKLSITITKRAFLHGYEKDTNFEYWDVLKTLSAKQSSQISSQQRWLLLGSFLFIRHSDNLFWTVDSQIQLHSKISLESAKTPSLLLILTNSQSLIDTFSAKSITKQVKIYKWFLSL